MASATGAHPRAAACLVGALSCGCVDDAGGLGPPRATGPPVVLVKAYAGKPTPPDFADAFTFIPRLDAQGRLVVDVRMKPGLHAYAAGEQIGRPVELRVLPTGGWAATGALVLPAGRERDLGPLGRSVVLEDAFSIALPSAG